MALQLLGKDPESEHGNSPTVYLGPARGTLVIQSWKARAEQVAQLTIPGHEDAIELPLRMPRFFPEMDGTGDDSDAR
ncbi:hypothetical protein OG948_15445 [Embleya sp. NBC_00888]|nr:hypothetical protein OG948_15445 [Embleya sp. NBC_00888]